MIFFPASKQQEPDHETMDRAANLVNNAANMLGNLTPYRSMSVNKGFYISKERA